MKEKKAVSTAYLLLLVACLFPSESSVRNERISSEEMDPSSLSPRAAESLERRN